MHEILLEEVEFGEPSLLYAIQRNTVDAVRELLELDVAISDDLDAVVWRGSHCRWSNDASNKVKELVRQHELKTVRLIFVCLFSIGVYG
jgi:hypothetical protein